MLYELVSGCLLLVIDTDDADDDDGMLRDETRSTNQQPKTSREYNMKSKTRNLSVRLI